MPVNCVEVITNPSQSYNMHESSEKKLLMNKCVNVIFHCKLLTTLILLAPTTVVVDFESAISEVWPGTQIAGCELPIPIKTSAVQENSKPRLAERLQ